MVSVFALGERLGRGEGLVAGAGDGQAVGAGRVALAGRPARLVLAVGAARVALALGCLAVPECLLTPFLHRLGWRETVRLRVAEEEGGEHLLGTWADPYLLVEAVVGGLVMLQLVDPDAFAVFGYTGEGGFQNLAVIAGLRAVCR